MKTDLLIFAAVQYSVVWKTMSYILLINTCIVSFMKNTAKNFCECVSWCTHVKLDFDSSLFTKLL